MTQRIRFDNDVPHWLRRLCRRWFRVLYPENWTLHVRMMAVKEMEKRYGATTVAVTVSEVAHTDIGIWFSAGLRNEPDVWRTVVHELRHAFFAEFTALLDYLWDGRRKIGKADAHKLLDRLIERMIQQDVTVIAKLKGLP